MRRAWRERTGGRRIRIVRRRGAVFGAGPRHRRCARAPGPSIARLGTLGGRPAQTQQGQPGPGLAIMLREFRGSAVFIMSIL